MIKPLLIIVFFLCCSIFQSLAQQNTAQHRVYLLGNTADLNLNSSFFKNLEAILQGDDPYTVVINGDLIDTKVTGEPTKDDQERIKKLLTVITKPANGKAVIIPGDRDWANSGENGWKSVKALERMVDDLEMEKVEWAVSKGCPGPESIELSDNLILVALNTQWWNHPFSKPSPADGSCKIVTRTDFINELEEELEEANGKNLLVAGHFPLISIGEYGGRVPIKTHLFPPIYGSFKAAFRQNIGTPQDIINEKFDPIRKKLASIILEKSSVVYASGHEYNLQVLRHNESFLINSGAASKETSYVDKKATNALFAASINGLIELVYHENGKVDYRAHQSVDDSAFTILKQEVLLETPCGSGDTTKLLNTAYIPCQQGLDVVSDNTSSSTKTTKVAGGDYPAKGLKRFLFGEHYRATWGTKISVPYLDLYNTNGGLSVYEKGGGRQTTSLKIKGGDGKEYVFRSVDKDPTKILHKELQGTLISELLQDATSMQHPYGALAISAMLDNTNILHARPQLYVLPNDPKLGPFQLKYANLVGTLEEKPINTKKVEVPFAGAEEVLQSYKLFRKLYKNHDNKINTEEYAQARMFDILVGDWGKHEDNWKWAGYANDMGGRTYRPIPRDRDHVFSLWDGFLIWLLDRKWAKESGENFGYTINDIRSLTWQSRHSDRFLLSELEREDWIAAAKYIQSNITDEVIEQSVQRMPKDAYHSSGSEIEKKLKRRIKDLDKYALEYYLLLSKEVEVVGSNKRENFEVVRDSDGSVSVTMHAMKKNGDLGNLLYQRQFYPKETKEIHLYGLDGKDVFDISGSAKKSIKIRVVGGPKPDNIRDASAVNAMGKHTLIYENDSKAKVELNKEGKRIDHWNQKLYNFDRTRFAYNRYRPIFSIISNSTDGFGVTTGINFTRQKFGKQDFSAKHTVKGRFTSENINIITYRGRFRHVIRKWDVEVGGLLANNNNFPTFYGIGNDTENDDDLDDDDFYNTQYETYAVHANLVKDFWKKSSLRLGLNYENNQTTIEPGTILAEANPNDIPGLDDVNLTEAIVEFDLDFRDRSSLPERGVLLYIKHQNGIINNKGNDNYGITRAYVEKYASLRRKNPWTLGLRVGGSRSYGEEVIPFYKMVFLGQRNGLRGFERNRFTGKSTIYFNSELRIQLSQFRTSIVPMKFGVKGFYDVGRVYSKFDLSDDLHSGYGLGVYLVPVKESFAIDISVGFSDEESGLILLNIGAALR